MTRHTLPAPAGARGLRRHQLYSTARLHYRRALEDAAVEGEHAGIRKRLAALDGLSDRSNSPSGLTLLPACGPGACGFTLGFSF